MPIHHATNGFVILPDLTASAIAYLDIKKNKNIQYHTKHFFFVFFLLFIAANLAQQHQHFHIRIFLETKQMVGERRAREPIAADRNALVHAVRNLTTNVVQFIRQPARTRHIRHTPYTPHNLWWTQVMNDDVHVPGR